MFIPSIITLLTPPLEPPPKIPNTSPALSVLNTSMSFSVTSFVEDMNISLYEPP